MIEHDYAALKAHFVNNWTGAQATYDNQPNVTLDDSPRVMFSVRPGASAHDAGATATGLKRQIGRVWLKISIQAQDGEGPAIAQASKFAALFRNLRLTGAAAHAPGTPGPYKAAQIDCGTEEIGSTMIEDGRFIMTMSVPWDSLRRY